MRGKAENDMGKLCKVKPDRNKMIQVCFFLFLAIGILVRAWKLGSVPAGVNHDEAYGAYEAYSLLHYGVDSNGHPFPVYLEVWNSGMSVLNTYLMMPLIALFGLHTWVIRIPEMVVACLTLCAVYGIMKRVINQTAAICCLFLLAVSPWHIMMSRWSLDANLAPGFLIFGWYFFMRGLEKSRFFPISALMYGLSLYCYATIWPFVPLIILLQFGYCILQKKVTWSKEIVISAVLLFFMALPLFLFLLVNKGIIGEINLGFFSIPKISHMRASEITFTNIIPNLKTLWYILKRQSDGLIWNISPEYGFFYLFTMPFFFLGLFFHVVHIIKSIIQRKFCPEMFVMIQLFAAGLVGLLIEANINRVNILLIPMIIVAASGIYYLCEMADIRLLLIPFVIYVISFGKFEKYYYTDYQEQLSPWFGFGLEEALQEACSHEGTIYVDAVYSYSRIMYYCRIPVTDFLETVERYDNEDGTRSVMGFDRFQFEFDENHPAQDGIYLLDATVNLQPYEEGAFTLHYFENYVVAIPK